MKAAIVSLAGAELSGAEAALLRALPPVGVILFGRNIEGAGQLARLVGALRGVLPAGAVLMVDQEGGRVARLRPPGWLAHPAARAAGLLFARDAAAGTRLAWLTGALIGLDCAEAGFDVVCAPVLDVLAEGATEAIGDRSFGGDGGQVAALGRAMAAGLLAAGVQPVGKHVPGHGGATVDSHAGLPRVAGVAEAEVAAFTACADLPWMMTAHIVYEALDAVWPATLSARVIGGVVRGRIGFEGVLVSDDLAMSALSGPPGALAAAAVAAGCDVALHCSGRIEDGRAVLEAVPAVSGAGLLRLSRGAGLAARSRVGLERGALVAEREGLLR